MALRNICCQRFLIIISFHRFVVAALVLYIKAVVEVCILSYFSQARGVYAVIISFDNVPDAIG